MKKTIYTLLDELLQEDLQKALEAYQVAKTNNNDLDTQIDEALLTYGNTAKNRMMKLRELSKF